MARFTPNPSDPQTLFFSGSSAGQMQADAQSAIGALVGRLISAISLSGTGNGTRFILKVEHTAAADVEGLSTAAVAAGLRLYQGTSPTEIRAAYIAALSASVVATSAPLAADVLVGAGHGATFMGLVVSGFQALTASTVFPQLRVGEGVTAPTIVEVGPSLGFVMTVGALLYFETPLDPRIDRTKDIVLGIGWAPTGSEAAKLVTWSADVGMEEAGSDVSVVTTTQAAVDVAVPDTVAIYARTAITIPAASIVATADEIHVVLTRIATAADPVADPAIHHVAVTQQRAA